MMLGAFGVCGCLALPIAIQRMRNLKLANKRQKRSTQLHVKKESFDLRVEALYDVDRYDVGALYNDDLSFVTGEIIVVIGMSVIGIFGVLFIRV